MNIYENGNNWVIEDQLNSSLVDEIKYCVNDNINSLHKFKEGYSTRGKNSEQYWIIRGDKKFLSNSLNFEQLKLKYTNEVFNKLEKSNLISQFFFLINLNCWTVIGEEGSYHAAHNHNLGRFDGISTVLYLQVPETNLSEECENNLFLVADSSPKNLIYSSSIPSTIEINPEVGKLLIFPSWIVHGTYPQTKGVRQTFNLDYIIESKKNKTTFSKNFNYF